MKKAIRGIGSFIVILMVLAMYCIPSGIAGFADDTAGGIGTDHNGGYLVSGIDTANEWQVLGNEYDGCDTTDKILSNDGRYRVQKNVVPTGNENEFLVYMSIDVKAQFMEYFQRAVYMATTSNNYHASDLGNIVPAMTGNQNVLVTGDSGSGYKNSAVFTINDYYGNTVMNQQRLYWNQSNNCTFYLKTGNNDYILLGLSVKKDNSGTKIMSVDLSQEATEAIYADINNVERVEITDTMGGASGTTFGKYVEYMGVVAGDYSANDVPTCTDGTLKWNPIINPKTTRTGEGDNAWYNNASQLVYKVRLKTEEPGFDSCADTLSSPESSPAYQLNESATLSRNGSTVATFQVPTVRGLLYKTPAINKIDKDTQQPIAGAKFSVSRLDSFNGGTSSYTKESDATGADGITYVTDVPAGTYKIIESTVPTGYIPATIDNQLEFNYTDNPTAYAVDGDNLVLTGEAADPIVVEDEKLIPDTVVVSVEKDWQDNDNQDAVRPGTITIRLMKTVNGVTEEADVKTVAAADNWECESWNLPKETETGDPITYSVVEDPVDGYTTTISDPVITDFNDQGVKQHSYTVTNSHTPETVSFAGSKTWDDSNDYDTMRPGSIVVNLVSNGEVKESKTVTAADNWSWNFADKPKYDNGTEISYRITENPIDGYVYRVEGNDIINVHSAAQFDAEGSKTWVDFDNAMNTRPTTGITITLHRSYDDDSNVQTVGTQTATAANNWSWSFTNLPRYYTSGKDTLAYIYWITEDTAVSNYSSEVRGFNVTNTYTGPVTFNYESEDTSKGTVSRASETLAQSAASAQGSNASPKTGYHFVNWTLDGEVVSTDANFVPAKPAEGWVPVTYVAHFAKDATQSYNVTYEYDGDVPEGASALPTDSNDYEENAEVNVATVTAPEGYEFSGWKAYKAGTTEEVTITEGHLDMPASNVVIKGEFTPINYNVTYEYTGDVPTTAPAAPTDTTDYNMGDEATVETITAPEGYMFMGWTAYLKGTETEVDIVEGKITMPASDVVLKGYFMAADYSVKYEYVGDVPATAPAAPIDDDLYNIGRTVDVKNVEAPAGYTFSGWKAYKENTTTEVEIADNKITMPASNIVLKGSWSEKEPVTIYYKSEDTDMGTVSRASDADLNPDLGTAYGSEATAKTGYHFVNWTVENDTASVCDDEEYVPTKPDDGWKTVTYVAHFAPYTYTVTYKYKGTVPTGAPAVPTDTGAYTAGASVNINTDPLMLAGYTFSGWTDAYTGEGESKQDVEITGANFTMPSGDVVVEGEWVEKEHVNIFYESEDTNKGTVDNPCDNLNPEIGVAAGSTATAKAGYEFTGWTVKGSTDVLSTDAKYTPTKPEGGWVTVTYQAHFTPIDYGITYQYTGDVPTTAPSVPTDSNAYHVGDTAEVQTITPPDGYTFSGWTAYDSDNNPVTITEGQLTVPASDIVIKGNFTPIDYHVTYSYTGTVPAAAPAAPTDDSDYNVGDDVTVQTVTAPEGYEFSGWTAYKKGTDTKVSITDGKFDMPASDVELKGNFTPIDYGITYQYTGDVPTTAPTVPTDGNTYHIGDTADVQTITPPDGYTFSGWTAYDSDNNPVTITEGTLTVPASDIVIKGNFTPIDYHVTYSYTGTVPAAAPAAPTDDEDYNMGDEATVKTITPPDGYTFSGWTAYKKGTDTEVTITGDKFDMPASDVELKGKFTPIDYGVTYEYTGDVPSGAPLAPTDSSLYHVGNTANVQNVTAPDGYTFSGWTAYKKGTDTEVTITDGKITMPASDVVLKGSFTEKTHVTITYQSSDTNKGTVTNDKDDFNPDTGQPSGSTAQPKDNYHFVNWTLDGEEVSTDPEFTPTKPEGGWTDATYVANFEENTYGYTVHYYWNGTTEKVADDKTADGKHRGDEITESPATVDYCTPVSTDSQKITISDKGENVIIFYYYKNVKVTANSDGPITYDGEDHTVSGYTVTDGSGSEVPGVDFTDVTAGVTGKHVGDYDSTFNEDPVGTVDDSGKYIISNSDNGKLVIVKPEDHSKVVTKTHEGADFKLGEEVVFTISVKNVYKVPKNISIEEIDGFSIGQSTFSNVQPGETVSTVARHSITESDIIAGSIVNTATAKFADIEALPEDPTEDYEATDTGNTEEKRLSLVVTKTSDVAEGAKVEVGTKVTYTVMVENQGNVTISNIKIHDNLEGAELAPGESEYISALAPGESTYVHYTYVVEGDDQDAGQIDNTATAEGTDPTGETVTGEAASKVAVKPKEEKPQKDDPKKEPKKDNHSNGSGGGKDSSASTGDDTVMWPWIATALASLAGMIGIGGTEIARRRRESK